MNIEAIKEKILNTRLTNIEEIIKCCDEAYELARKEDCHELLGFIYFYKGEAYYLDNDIKSMFECMNKAIPYLRETDQWALLTRAYTIMAITSINKGNPPVAVDYYMEALDCAKKHNLQLNECSIHINLGYLYMQSEIYEEANEQFEAAYDIYQSFPDKENKRSRLVMIYNNQAMCCMLQGRMDCARDYVERLHEQCRPYFNDMDYVYVGCMEARYYHYCGDPEKRDEIIQDIISRLQNPDGFNGPFPILDVFDDILSLCHLALDIGENDVCIKLAQLIEPAIENTDIKNMERQFLALKIRYYKMQNDMEKYRQASTQFYEVLMIMDEEDKQMIANMIRNRTALEQVKAQNALLTEKSETDALTGLANRYRLADYSQQMMDDCLRDKVPYGIEILDIDYFKEYNDNYGHHAGDNCIMQVAALLSDMQCENIFCARYGGDEFIVIYKGLSRAEIIEKAKRLKQNIADLKLEHEYSKCSSIVTISQGICVTVPTRPNKSWDFLHEADNCLYCVKRNNRNGICVGDAKEMELIE